MVRSRSHFKKYFLTISITMWGAVEPLIKAYIVLQELDERQSYPTG